MADTHETITDIIAEKRRRADEIERNVAEKMKSGEMISDRYARELVADIRREADRLEAAHKREHTWLRQEIAGLKALLRGLRKIAHGVPTTSLHTPWISRGRLVFPDSEHADAGDIIATFEDVDGVSAGETVCAVNAFIELRDHLDRHFHDKEAT